MPMMVSPPSGQSGGTRNLLRPSQSMPSKESEMGKVISIVGAAGKIDGLAGSYGVASPVCEGISARDRAIVDCICAREEGVPVQQRGCGYGE